VIIDDEENTTTIPPTSVPILVIPIRSVKSTAKIPSPPITKEPSVQQMEPLSVKYPLEVHAIREELESFFKTDDPSSLTFPSLHKYPKPKNLDEYLKLKAQQAEDIARERSSGKPDSMVQMALSAELNKVRFIEDVAQCLSKSYSEAPMDESTQQDVREACLDHIMTHKPYKATKEQFRGWTVGALKEEIQRIQEMLKDPLKKPTPPPVSSQAKSRKPIKLSN